MDLLRQRVVHEDDARPGVALIFLDLMAWRVPSGSRRWIEGMNALIHPRTADAEPFFALFAESAQLLGQAPIALRPAEVLRLRAARVDWPLDGWTIDELGRVVLLLGAAGYLAPGTLERLVDGCYHRGDARQRQALLRALPLLPRPERFRTLALEACLDPDPRTFEALVCENPYPVRHFSPAAFDDMVVRAKATGVRLERIVGLVS